MNSINPIGKPYTEIPPLKCEENIDDLKEDVDDDMFMRLVKLTPVDHPDEPIIIGKEEDLEEEVEYDDDIILYPGDMQKLVNSEIRKAFLQVPNEYIKEMQVQESLKRLQAQQQKLLEDFPKNVLNKP